jgi:mRNA-degrading endonuclease RelE of RelBE toxin-antitoxin system
MNYEVLVTDNFKRETRRLLKKFRSLNKDLEKLIMSLEQNPDQGISLGKDCYKIRMNITFKNKGKSSGSRVITYVKFLSGFVFLISIYDKSEKDNIIDTELDRLLKLAGL